MPDCVLEGLEGQGEDGARGKQGYPEDDVLRKVYGSVSDVSPREWLDVWWRFGYCHIVSPEDAAEPEEEAEEGENFRVEGHVWAFADLRERLRLFLLLSVNLSLIGLHNQLSLHNIYSNSDYNKNKHC